MYIDVPIAKSKSLPSFTNQIGNSLTDLIDLQQHFGNLFLFYLRSSYPFSFKAATENLYKTSMNHAEIQLDDTYFVCFIRTRDDELPQLASPNRVPNSITDHYFL